MTITEVAPPDHLAQVKRRQQQIWSSGDYRAIATLIHPVSDALARRGRPAGRHARARRGLRHRQRGDRGGPVQLPRRYRLRARTSRSSPRPRRRGGPRRSTCSRATPRRCLPDGAFDAVLSVVGAMFAPDHEQTAAELARVCRPGGIIGIATWTPDGFLGDMFRVVARRVPPPAESRHRSTGAPRLRARAVRRPGRRPDRHDARLRLPVRVARGLRRLLPRPYGPTLKAFEAVGHAGEDALYGSLVDLVHRHAGTSSGAVAVPATWLETVAVRS